MNESHTKEACLGLCRCVLAVVYSPTWEPGNTHLSDTGPTAKRMVSIHAAVHSITVFILFYNWLEWAFKTRKWPFSVGLR